MKRKLDSAVIRDRFVFSVLTILIVFAIVLTAYYPIKNYVGETITKTQINSVRDEMNLEPVNPREIYDTFQCPCCGKSIDEDCCGMSKERKEFVDGMMFDGAQEADILIAMAKRFGYETFKDSEKEAETKKLLEESVSEDSPIISIENPKYDFGTIYQNDGLVQTTFKVRNNGKSDLVITGLDTSCMCTSAKLRYAGTESPEFGMSMHGNNPKNYELRIPPGQSSELIVTYDPLAHGLQKKTEQRIIRYVTIISNDPVNFQKKVRIELTQLKGGEENNERTSM